MGAEISALAVFCGSKSGLNEDYAKAAAKTGGLLAENNIRLVYGGGSIGLMGIVVESALRRGGKVTGVIPKFLLEYEVGNPKIEELIIVDSMHERKRTMFDRSDGFIVLPGGLGTLDEAIEVVTWKQLRQHRKPIVFLSVNGYWEEFRALVAKTVGHDFAHEKIGELFTVVTEVEEVLPAIHAAPEPDEITPTSHL